MKQIKGSEVKRVNCSLLAVVTSAATLALSASPLAGKYPQKNLRNTDGYMESRAKVKIISRCNRSI